MPEITASVPVKSSAPPSTSVPLPPCASVPVPVITPGTLLVPAPTNVSVCPERSIGPLSVSDAPDAAPIAASAESCTGPFHVASPISTRSAPAPALPEPAMMSGSLLTLIPASRTICASARISGSPSALFASTLMVPPETVMSPVSVLVPERLQMPVPTLLSVPLPLMFPEKVTLFASPTVSAPVPMASVPAPVMLATVCA